MTVNELNFEQRLGKAWLESGFSETDFRELIESHSDLVELVGQFTKTMEVVLQGFDPEKIDPDKFEELTEFINSLEDNEIEKHCDLGMRMIDKHGRNKLFKSPF